MKNVTWISFLSPSNFTGGSSAARGEREREGRERERERERERNRERDRHQTESEAQEYKGMHDQKTLDSVFFYSQ